MAATLTRDQQDALDIARQLAAAGIPIFVAYSDSSASTGSRLPSKWQRTIPDPAVVDSWRPGMALCAVMGHGLDLVDIDPRNGGDPAALDGEMPISYGCATTPSGGVHFFVKSLGVRSCDNVVAGIDVKAGDSTGAGRGFAFIAPTERVSKVDGVKRPYQWIVPPDLHRLGTEGPQDDSGKALVRLINAKRNGHHPASCRAPTPAEFMQCRPWDDIKRTLAEGRNNGTHKLASALRGKGGHTLEDAIDIMYTHVWPLIETTPGDHPFTQAEFETTIRSAWRYPDGAEQRATENINGAESAKTPLAGAPPLNSHSGVAAETQPAGDADFWEAREMLTHIRDFALSRRASPWATLGVVLVRVTATIPPRVVLPPLVGGVAGLNLFVALVGESGSGKGAAIATATDAIGLTANFTTHTVGSGQGIAHGFAHRERGVGIVRHADSAVFILEEIDHLVGLTGQTGSTLLPELRRVWMGERLGHLYVDPNKRLEIEQHTYRAGLIAGVQPGRAGVLLNDSEGGTPQRFIWLPVTYPHPDQRPTEPRIRSWTPPQWHNDPHPPTPQAPALPVMPRVTLSIPDCAKTEIDAALLARARGQVHALDGHRLLCQLKVAAALGILDQRSMVNEEDWQLAGRVMAYSDVVRDWVIRYLSTQASAQNQAKATLEAQRAVTVADAVEDGAIARVARSIIRILTRAEGWLSHKQLRTRLAARDRGYFDTALEHLLAAGQVQTEPTERGTQYRAARGGDGAQ